MGGATLVVDGREGEIAGSKEGFFLGGTLFDHVKPEMKIYREEIFGPVLCIVRVPDFATAVELINKHEFGNGVACFTSEGGSALCLVIITLTAKKVCASTPDTRASCSVGQTASPRGPSSRCLWRTDQLMPR